MKKVFYIANL